MLRKASTEELMRRALRRLKRNKALWWRPEIIQLGILEGRLEDLLDLAGNLGKGVETALSVLTEGGWISMDLNRSRGQVEEARITYPAVLEGRKVSREELEELVKRKYEAILRLRSSS
jgi:hypothetical protein